MTTSTPKSINELQWQDNVIFLNEGEAPETAANRFFHELFDAEKAVKVNLLFSEDGQKVYESYQDSGSVDYLYMISK